MGITSFKPKVIATKEPPKMVVQQEVLKALEPGQLLFAQGDSGGDLYFIESGVIEIFITKNGQDIVLSQMGPGEVIGVMTLLTREPRLAGARAVERSKLKKITKSSVTTLISTLPKWLHIVLKEFTIRINEMNRRYSETLLELKKSRENQATMLFLGRQMARGALVLGQMMANGTGGDKVIVVEEMLEKTQSLLNLSKEMTAKIWSIFEECQMVKLEPNSEKRRRLVSLRSLEALGDFATFMNDAQTGPSKKILKARLNFKEISACIALIKYVTSSGGDGGKHCEISTVELRENCEKKTGIAWDLAHFEKAVKLNLITLTGSGDQMVVGLNPNELERVIKNVLTMKKLLGEFSEESIRDAEATPASDEASELTSVTVDSDESPAKQVS